MKGTSALSLALCAPLVSAFPKAMYEYAEHMKRAGNPLVPPQGGGFLPLIPPPFDAKSQYVSNQGQYKFVAPGVGDDRGECPGLNALANHGYIPHNGRATIQQFVDGTYAGFGMASDLANFLSYYGAFFDGDGASWSIGGLPRTGIAGSHGDYESDSSPMRGDLNQWGSNSKLQITQFKRFYAMQPDAATANYNLEVLRQFRVSRFQESIDKNPWFSYQVFTGPLVSQAAFTFIYRFMSNKSAEYPEGRLDKATLKSFMSIQGSEDNLYWVPGHEKFPDNFYKRNDNDQYSIPYFLTDVAAFAEPDPRILGIGCNQGAVDTYMTIDPAAYTNQAYTFQQAASSPLCFFAEAFKVEAPIQSGASPAQLAPFYAVLDAATAGMNCQKIGSVNQTIFAECPGFSFYGGPTGPVAPGAIQN